VLAYYLKYIRDAINIIDSIQKEHVHNYFNRKRIQNKHIVTYVDKHNVTKRDIRQCVNLLRAFEEVDLPYPSNVSLLSALKKKDVDITAGTPAFETFKNCLRKFHEVKLGKRTRSQALGRTVSDSPSEVGFLIENRADLIRAN
jgi:hypothetical protein